MRPEPSGTLAIPRFLGRVRIPWNAWRRFGLRAGRKLRDFDVFFVVSMGYAVSSRFRATLARRGITTMTYQFPIKHIHLHITEAESTR